MNRLAQFSGKLIGTLQTSWLFRDRTWTSKQYLEYDHSESVHVSEQSTSPAFIIQEWFFAGLTFGIAALLWREILQTGGGNSLATALTMIIAIVLASLLTGATLFFSVYGIERWLRAHFTGTRCAYCNESVTYPHTFTEGGLGNKRTHRFCSKDCREQWERENVDYPFSGYYDIQDEETEQRVEYEHYSSAYEVQDD